MPAPESSLEDIRVLELCGGGLPVAGAFCGRLFAGYGADVIAVEPPRGSPLRRHGPFVDEQPHRETGALWLYLGANKRGVTLDLATVSGQRLFRRLVEDANVVVESYPPGHLESLGLGFDTLKSIKKRIVLVSVTAYGQDGPNAGRPATNLTSFASGGQMSLTGDPEREPLVNGGYQAEYQAGLQAFAAAALAAHQADATEVPQHVDISAQECMASALELYLPWWAYLKRDIAKRRGNVMSAMVGVFPAAEGHIGLHIMPRNWPHFARAIGREDLVDDPRFRDGHSRLANNDELEAIVYAWAASGTAKELYRRAAAERVPAAFVHSLGDLRESEQLRERGYFQEVDHPAAGRLTYPGAPFRLGEVPWTAGRAPLLGEHNAEVYGEELGLSGRELCLLRAAGAV
jgi:crotonobetainyl-CoA:carnitine CoA-transferase CaiB-like acyl-CoA transferase